MEISRIQGHDQLTKLPGHASWEQNPGKKISYLAGAHWLQYENIQALHLTAPVPASGSGPGKASTFWSTTAVGIQVAENVAFKAHVWTWQAEISMGCYGATVPWCHGAMVRA